MGAHRLPRARTPRGDWSEDLVTDSDADNYGTSSQGELWWTGPRLIVLGFLTLGFGLAVIYTAATIIGQ
jgi:hypothetical protein